MLKEQGPKLGFQSCAHCKPSIIKKAACNDPSRLLDVTKHQKMTIFQAVKIY
jgi:hypothetical protein